MAYSNKVLDHYENPRNVGSFDKSNDSVGTGMVGAPACGDVMAILELRKKFLLLCLVFKPAISLFTTRIQTLNNSICFLII